MFIRSALPLTLVAMFAAPLAAQCHCQGGPRPGERGFHPEGGPLLMRGLNLTEAQKKSLKALADTHREAMKGKHEAAMAAMKAFHEAMLDPATSADQLKTLHEKATQAQFELALDRRGMMQESLALLTPEQKAKAEKLRKEGPKGMPRRGEGFRHGRGPGHDGGPGHEAPPEGPAPEAK